MTGMTWRWLIDEDQNEYLAQVDREIEERGEVRVRWAIPAIMAIQLLMLLIVVYLYYRHS